jgi:hypothetical protein
MVSLADAVLVLTASVSPPAVPLVDYVVADQGSGPQIAFWSKRLGPQPTADQLAAVTADQATAARRQQTAQAAGALLVDPGPVGTALRAVIAAAGLTLAQVQAQLPSAA